MKLAHHTRRCVYLTACNTDITIHSDNRYVFNNNNDINIIDTNQTKWRKDCERCKLSRMDRCSPAW